MKGFGSNLFTGMISIDLQKAFDTIDHKILLEKMHFFGFLKKVVSYFKSYLLKRQFKINLDGTFSEAGHVTCEVSQGSILWPLLFLLYMNDIPQAVNCELLLYTDILVLFAHIKTLRL